MQPGVYEFFGVNYYTHGTGLILVLPIVIWLFFAVILLLSQLAENIFEKAGKPLKWRSVLIPAAMIPISFVVAFWDVYLIGQQATKLCKEQAGLHVYKTVEADGFIGDSSIDYWSKFGFKYVERRDGDRKLRYYLVNGEVKFEYVDSFKSKYELLDKEDVISKSIIKSTYFIKSNIDECILGDIVNFVIHCGWVDMLIINITGFTYSAWNCDVVSLECNRKIDMPGISVLIKLTLKPSGDGKEE